MSILNNRIGGIITNSTFNVHGVINTNVDINNPSTDLSGVNLPFTTPGSTPGNILVTDGSNILAWSELKTINGSSIFGSGDLTTAAVPPGVVSNNNINGTPNRITKWTTADKIGDSQIIDDGNEIYVGASYGGKFNIEASTSNIGIFAVCDKIGGPTTGISGHATGSGNGTNIGVSGNAGYSDGTNIGVYGTSTATTVGYNIGVYAYASGGDAGTHAIQITDPTASVAGRYLRNMTTNGLASWANINITEVTNGLSTALLGAPNGIATLDSNSKLVMSQMPISVMEYKGTYDILANTPVLVDGTGNQGDVYVCTTAGTGTFGVGNTLTVSVGDWLIYNGTKWEKALGNNVGSGTVTSIGLSLGTTGTDINISNSPITSSGNINLNIPTSSATARGLLSTTDWTTFNDKVAAPLSTTNFVARFTGTNTIGNAALQDNGSTTSIGTAPNSSYSFDVRSDVVNRCAIHAESTPTYTNGAVSIGIRSDATFTGTGVTNTASYGSWNLANNGLSSNVGAFNMVGGQIGLSANENYGSISAVVGYPSGMINPTNVGVYGYVFHVTSSNPSIAGKFVALPNLGSGSTYSLQLKDGTEGSGKFLKCVGGIDGYANWATITAADISGAVGAVNGTTNYIAKFTTNGTTIGNSLIQDDGSTLSVGAALNANAKFYINSTSQRYGLVGSSADSIGIGVAGTASGNGAVVIGVEGSNSGTADINYGVSGASGSATGKVGVGGRFYASGVGTKYSVQLQDGTEGTGKFLKSVTTDGKANWASITAADVSGAVGSVNGTNNYIAKFTSNGTTIGNSQIQDNGTNVGVGYAGSSTTKFAVQSDLSYGIISQTTVSNSTAGQFFSNGLGAGTNTGLSVLASNATTSNIGIGVISSNGTGDNIGIDVAATNGTNRYALRLKDGSEASGKFLKSITGDGKANWANITAADVSGVVDTTGGTANYLSKFTDANTIEESLIQDDGTTIGIGIAPNANNFVLISNTVKSVGLLSQTSFNSGIGLYGQGVSGTGNLTGVYGLSNSATATTNTGVHGKAMNTGTTNIGVTGEASGGTNNYCAKLTDGTEASGKFLKSVTSDGKANWAYLPGSAQFMCSDMTTPITASTTIAKAFWIAPCNGKLTDIFANLYTPQVGGADFSVSIKMNGVTIASPSFTAGAQQSSIIVTPNTFTKGILFEVFVIQIGDGTAKGLLTTINYERT